MDTTSCMQPLDVNAIVICRQFCTAPRLYSPVKDWYQNVAFIIDLHKSIRQNIGSCRVKQLSALIQELTTHALSITGLLSKSLVLQKI